MDDAPPVRARRRPLKRVIAPLVLTVAALESATFVLVQGRSVAPETYAQLASPVDEIRQETMPIIVDPAWAEPHVRTALGDERFPVDQLAHNGLERFASVVEISVDAWTGDQPADEATTKQWEVSSERQVGPFTVRTRKNPKPELVLYDFVRQLGPDDAVVSLTQPQPAQEVGCPWKVNATPSAGGLGGHATFARQRFQCPTGLFYHVGRTIIADQDFEPRHCLWAHPPPQGALKIDFHNVNLGERLVGHSGMYWIIERTKKGPPVTMDVVVDGASIGTVVHRDGDGWAPFSLPTEPRQAADVQFVVSATDASSRHFCFEASTR